MGDPHKWAPPKVIETLLGQKNAKTLGATGKGDPFKENPQGVAQHPREEMAFKTLPIKDPQRKKSGNDTYWERHQESQVTMSLRANLSSNLVKKVKRVLLVPNG